MTAKQSSEIVSESVTALILAGGAGRRMNGQDKGLIVWRSKPLVAHIIDCIPAHIKQILISCNRNTDHYQKYAATVSDNLAGYQGPLAGIYAALNVIDTELVFILPCDSPAPPQDLLDRLYLQLSRDNADICYAHDGNRGQYLFALLKTELKENLSLYLKAGGRSVNQWYKQLNCTQANCSGQATNFLNFNQLSDISTKP
jgi:molybdenum cofactor guanylyltransferase